MNNEELKEKRDKPLPDASDERFWDDVSRELWFMFKQAEDVSDLAAGNADELFGAAVESSKPESTPTSRVKCLTFDRCAEIGQTRTEISKPEKTHLENCRFCERRIAKFAQMPFAPMTAAANAAEETPKKSWRETVLSAGGWSAIFGDWSGKAAFAGLALILLAAAGFVWVLNGNQSSEQLAGVSDPMSNFPNSNAPVIADGKTTETGGNARPAANSFDANSSVSVNKMRETETSANTNQSSEEPPLELAFLPQSERDAVRQSLQAGRIQISEDLAKLRENPIVRDGGFYPQISPKDEAVREDQPILSWRGAADSEYKIVVFDRELNEVAKSEVLTQNSWQINKKLKADFYFWQVLVREKGAANFDSNGKQAFFKIAGETEKSRIEKAKKLNKSKLAAAVLYARAGLFREAERELEAELKQDPGSAKARKMFAQVRRWRSR